MYEPIDTDSTDADQPLSDWVGKRLINNALALSDRGWSGSYVWSSEVNSDTPVTGATAAPSAVSTHPDYFYSIPLVLPPTVAQTEITIQLSYVLAGSMDVGLWVNGQATAPTTLTDTASAVATTQITITLPTAQPIATRAALLLRSVIDPTPEDTGSVSGVSQRAISASTNTAPADLAMFHRAVILSGTTGDALGLDMPQTYHVIRAEDVSSADLFYTFPDVDPAIWRPGGVPVGISIAVHEIGTIQLTGLQVYSETASTRGVPTVRQVDAGEVVRAETIRRIAKRCTDVQRTAIQVPWVGGVGGVARSTAAGVIAGRFWGALVRTASDSAILSTQVRARDGVRGVIVSVMYLADQDATLAVSLAGATASQFGLAASASTTQIRDLPGDAGTMHWRHRSYTRNQCSAQDIGFHGPSAPGFRGDVSRLAVASFPVFFASTPTADSLVSVEVDLSPETRGSVYLASVTVVELLDLTSAADWPDVEPPSVMPYREIRDESIAALVARGGEVFASRLRCAYSELGDPLGTVLVTLGGSRTAVTLSWTTSPDLPAGTVLRFTADAASCTIVAGVDATTASTVHGARSVQSSDIAIASATTYSLTIVVTVAAATTGTYYALRIEELAP